MNEDMSSIFEKLSQGIDKNNISPDMVNNFINMLNNNSNNNDTNISEKESQKQSPNLNNIDIETMLKMKSIIDKMNTKDDPRSSLLMSLKPYLKDSRKGKVDQYIQLLNMSKVMDVFPFMGGDKKNADK